MTPVKSVKKHLLKTVGNSSIAYEQLETLQAQVEMSLSSGPLRTQHQDTFSLGLIFKLYPKLIYVKLPTADWSRMSLSRSIC